MKIISLIHSQRARKFFFIFFFFRKSAVWNTNGNANKKLKCSILRPQNQPIKTKRISTHAFAWLNTVLSFSHVLHKRMQQLQLIWEPWLSNVCVLIVCIFWLQRKLRICCLYEYTQCALIPKTETTFTGTKCPLPTTKGLLEMEVWSPQIYPYLFQ